MLKKPHSNPQMLYVAMALLIFAGGVAVYAAFAVLSFLGFTRDFAALVISKYALAAVRFSIREVGGAFALY